VRNYSVFTTTQAKVAASRARADISNTGSVDPLHIYIHAEFQRTPRAADSQTLSSTVR
jgi:hypothetical protein